MWRLEVGISQWSLRVTRLACNCESGDSYERGWEYDLGFVLAKKELKCSD